MQADMLSSYAVRKDPSVGTRIGSMVVDHIIMSVVAVLFFMPLFVSVFSDALEPHNDFALNFLKGTVYFSTAGLALYCCKDCIRGRSIAKRLFRLQVINNETGEPAGPLKCFIRNLFCVLWPLEALITFFQPARRLGDMVAGTRVVEYEPAAHQSETRWQEVLIAFVLSYGLVVMVFSAFKPYHGGASFNKNSYNDALSRELTQLYTDSLGAYLTPDIKVYDSIPGDNRRFVSLVFYLKENYLEDDARKRGLDDIVSRLLYGRMPAHTIKGRLHYIYRKPGYRSSASKDL